MYLIFIYWFYLLLFFRLAIRRSWESIWCFGLLLSVFFFVGFMLLMPTFLSSPWGSHIVLSDVLFLVIGLSLVSPLSFSLWYNCSKNRYQLTKYQLTILSKNFSRAMSFSICNFCSRCCVVTSEIIDLHSSCDILH